LLAKDAFAWTHPCLLCGLKPSLYNGALWRWVWDSRKRAQRRRVHTFKWLVPFFVADKFHLEIRHGRIMDCMRTVSETAIFQKYAADFLADLKREVENG
jgi:hypothetical protein